DVLGVRARARATSMSRANRIGPDRLRQHERTITMSARLATVPGSSLLLVPAQFGQRHRGQSIRRARARFAEHGFGLGGFAVACMLLTHPERLAQADQLYVDCPGDEYT